MANKTEKQTYEDELKKYYTDKTTREEMALTDQFQQNIAALRGQKDSNIADIEEANRGLYTSYMRDSSTLPEQMARAGITGGATESSQLRLMQDYRNNVAANDRNLFEANKELDTEITNLSSEYRNVMAEVRAENEMAKANALEEYKQDVAKSEQDAIKNALDMYKSTGLTEFLSGIFTPAQIETIVATNGGGTSKDKEFNDLWERYENTGLASSLFDAGYNPYEVIQIAQNRMGVIYDAQGNALPGTEVDKSDIWSQFIDWSVQYLTNSPTLKDAFSVGTLEINGVPEDVSSVAQKLADGTYVMVENKNGGLTITNGKPKTPQTDANGAIIPTVDPLITDPIMPEGSELLPPGAEVPTDKTTDTTQNTYYPSQGSGAINTIAQQTYNVDPSPSQDSRDDARISNPNYGNYIYIDGHGWQSMGQIAQGLENGTIKETVTGINIYNQKQYNEYIASDGATPFPKGVQVTYTTTPKYRVEQAIVRSAAEKSVRNDRLAEKAADPNTTWVENLGFIPNNVFEELRGNGSVRMETRLNSAGDPYNIYVYAINGTNREGVLNNKNGIVKYQQSLK